MGWRSIDGDGGSSVLEAYIHIGHAYPIKCNEVAAYVGDWRLMNAMESKGQRVECRCLVPRLIRHLPQPRAPRHKSRQLRRASSIHRAHALVNHFVVRLPD